MQSSRDQGISCEKESFLEMARTPAAIDKEDE